MAACVSMRPEAENEKPDQDKEENKTVTEEEHRRPGHGFKDADYARRLQELQSDPPVEGLTWIVEKPFIVAGNQPSAIVRRHTVKTVRWATRMFRKHYFERYPDRIITIWLFGDSRSYRKAAKKITGREAGTPYGFCSDDTDSLIMNIATGGGTLVHEMFHAFVPANFEKCPSWFNEGVASLYEQCGKRNGMIVGYTNWRLEGLKTAIRGNKTITFKELSGTTSQQFYGSGSGMHYAQARYLCYYLQENGLLVKYYRSFRENVESDPTGYETLVEILGNPDMGKFQEQWEAWCLELRFP